MLKILTLIERNMHRNLRRTTLTVLTIALAIFVFTILISVPASMDRVISDAASGLRLVVNNKNAPWGGLPARYCAAIRPLPGAVACVALTGWVGIYRDASDPIQVFGAGPENSDVYPEYDPTGAIRREFFSGDRRAAYVGGVLLKKEAWRVGQLITLNAADPSHLTLSFVIRGTIRAKHYPNAFVVRRDYLVEARKAAGYREPNIAWFMIVRADSVEHLNALARQIDDHFHNSDYETRTVTESDALASGLSAVGNIRAIIAALGVVVIMTELLIAANSAAMTIRERTSEVAVMRALGFDRKVVAGLLFGECAAIGLFGGLIGSACAWRLCADGLTLGAALNGNGALWVTGRQAFAALLAAVAVSIVSGLIPILGVVRMPPATAFRKIV
jgi:putative ABC transport system permease protein